LGNSTMRPNIKSTQSENGSSRSKADFNLSELARAHSRRSAASDTAEHRVLRSVKRSATDQVGFFGFLNPSIKSSLLLALFAIVDPMLTLTASCHPHTKDLEKTTAKTVGQFTDGASRP
jgi:hypothetical protein